MIKYLGSKRLLVPTLGQLVAASGAQSTLDLFTGTTRVAQEFCRQGTYTYATDVASYSEVLAQCYVETDAEKVDYQELEDALAHLQNLPPKAGYFTETYCQKSRFFHPDNGAKIDAIRNGIDEHYANSPLRPILLTSLMEAADAVDSTVGLQMAYLKSWAPRALRPLTLKVPELTPGTGKAIRGDALELVKTLPKVDLAYLDPPYNQHRYYTNYHIWETLIRWDEPEVYGIACKRVDCKDLETKSPFNSKKEMPEALAQVVTDTQADLLMLSFNNEGFIPLAGLEEIVAARGYPTHTLTFDFKRYVGAQIGIHSPTGEKVGQVSHTKNYEYVILSGPETKLQAMLESLPAQ
ncbi:DNA methyltransferase [Boudabousia liubingyangii]|uniref:site-specific DNA-methyltransferase (adenine-specific) n=1 Tax=Boudabousia liubingyangii TaxID=1921764 RepID=A0A1Q5PQ30_9ACTO|nr:DNA adenine methylase [Boudabousia liubingyangii]OKL49609.1 DNA methyltransferase [Boudabousia liubingyangii]